MKYIEFEVDDSFDENKMTVFDAIDMGGTWISTHTVSRQELQDRLDEAHREIERLKLLP